MAPGPNALLNEKDAWYWFFYAGVVGILTSLAFVYITRYYTSGASRPVREIAEATKTGPATTIISGTAIGFETTAPSVITISVPLFLAYSFGARWSEATGFPNGGADRTALPTIGVLVSAALTLAKDTFGPVADKPARVLTMG